MLVTVQPALAHRHCRGALKDRGLALQAGIQNAVGEAVGEEARALAVAVQENFAVQGAELVLAGKGPGKKDWTPV